MLVTLGVTDGEATGVVAVIWLSLLTVKLAGFPPNVTEVAPVKPLPRMMTVEPPAPVPEVELGGSGEMLLTLGAAAKACPAVATSMARNNKAQPMRCNPRIMPPPPWLGRERPGNGLPLLSGDRQ